MRTPKYKWRLFKDKNCLGVFSKEEIIQITGMSRNNIGTYADLGAAYKGIYMIERVEDEKQSAEVGFAREWKKITRKLLRGAIQT